MPKIKVKGQTVQTGERPQTNGRTHTHTHGRYQTYYLPCYAVDNNGSGNIDSVSRRKQVPNLNIFQRANQYAVERDETTVSELFRRFI